MTPEKEYLRNQTAVPVYAGCLISIIIAVLFALLSSCTAHRAVQQDPPYEYKDILIDRETGELIYLQ